MNILILEDEPLAIEGLKNILNKNFTEIDSIDTAQSLRESFVLLNENKNKYDLIISDIRLSDGLSFEVHSTTKHEIPIIFTTAYDQYALEAFENNGVAYVLKPVNEIKFLEAMKKARKFYRKNSIPEEFYKAIHSISASNSYKKKFLGKIGNKVSILNSEDISCIYTENKLVFMQDLKNDKKYIINHSLEELEKELLDPDKFYRINRSTIVNLNALVEMKNHTNGRLQLKMRPNPNLQWIVARERVSEFKDWLNQ